jgi:hypothetical protein
MLWPKCCKSNRTGYGRVGDTKRSEGIQTNGKKEDREISGQWGVGRGFESKRIIDEAPPKFFSDFLLKKEKKMLHANEIEDPETAGLPEDDPQKSYIGRGYKRVGSHYLFTGLVQPSIPSEPATAEAMAGRSLSRLELELRKQENKLRDIYEPLEQYGKKIVEDARYGRPVVRTGLLASIFRDLDEQKFICQQLTAALAEEQEG